MKSGPFIAVAIAGLVAVGVATDSDARKPAPKAKTGTLEGVVSFRGTPPEREPLDRKRDPFCAKTKALSEKIVIDDGKLRDVHVRLPVGSAGEHDAPSEPAVLDQDECMYRPRVIGVVAGQKVNITNGDQTFHNVRGTKQGSTQFNHAQPSGADPIVRSDLGEPGDVITFRCDVHPWMRAFAVVTDHPFFDVTEGDGTFTIEDVPAGTHTLEAWHPELGLKKKKVTVKPGKTTRIRFTFSD